MLIIWASIYNSTWFIKQVTSSLLFLNLKYYIAHAELQHTTWRNYFIISIVFDGYSKTTQIVK